MIRRFSAALIGLALCHADLCGRRRSRPHTSGGIIASSRTPGTMLADDATSWPRDKPHREPPAPASRSPRPGRTPVADSETATAFVTNLAPHSRPRRSASSKTDTDVTGARPGTRSPRPDQLTGTKPSRRPSPRRDATLVGDVYTGQRSRTTRRRTGDRRRGLRPAALATHDTTTPPLPDRPTLAGSADRRLHDHLRWPAERRHGLPASSRRPTRQRELPSRAGTTTSVTSATTKLRDRDRVHRR